MAILTPFLATVRWWSCYGGLLLAVQWCGAVPPPQHAAAPPTAARQTPPKPGALAPLIRALLDTTATGSARAADARLGLQAGAELRAFYGAAGTPGWTTAADTFGANAAGALALLAHAREHGLRPADYGGPRLLALHDSLTPPALAAHQAGQLARFDVLLTDAVLSYLRDLNRGRLHLYTVSVREKAVGTTGRAAVRLRTALATSSVAAAVRASEPANREYRQLQEALAQWLAQPVVPDSAAAHRAQYELAALNLERWRWETMVPTGEYAWINIPAFELQVVAHDSVQRRHRVVVGAPKTRTPTLSSSIRYFTLAPDWHVPQSIAVKEMLPRLRRDPGYLGRNNYALYNARDQQLDPTRIRWAAVTANAFTYTIRQAACCENALGNIVFRFANPYSVYLHDTPLRQLFTRPYRALSHGCVRLESPFALAAYLLRREGRPALLPSEAECARQPRPHDVRLLRPLPICIRYATCTAENGQLRFFPDIYGRDEVLRRGLFGDHASASVRSPRGQ